MQARKWVPGQPATDHPGFKRRRDALREEDVQYTHCFSFAGRSRFWKNRRFCLSSLFNVLVEEMAEAVEKGVVGGEVAETAGDSDSIYYKSNPS